MESERRVPLNKDLVLSAAIALVDRDGIESLSMRKLGQALGVEAMSLYNHVANKDDILDGIADQVLTEIVLPAAHADWEAAIWRCATSAHDALAAHPWACTLVMSTPRPLPARLRYMDSVLRCLRQARFPAAAAYHGYHALDSHILGFTLWEAGHAIANVDEIADFLPMLRSQGYPYLAEHAEQHLAGPGDQDTGEFEFGLRLIVDGLKRMRPA
jgi:AcrR family transcriptional regulator